jgi:PTH2 family peptidyl-tRNA hydrolase
MARPFRIHVTGFGKFGGVEDNPSAHISRALAQAGVVDSSDVLEVSAEAVDGVTAAKRAELAAFATVSNAGPDGHQRVTNIIVHFGVAASAPAFYVEQVGVNDATFRIPDERGYQPRAGLVERGDDFARARLTPVVVKPIVDRLLSKGYPVQTSRDAGRFLCNYVYYKSLTMCERLNDEYSAATGVALDPAKRLPPFVAIFIHVPSQTTVDIDTQVQFAKDFIEELKNVVIAESSGEVVATATETVTATASATATATAGGAATGSATEESDELLSAIKNGDFAAADEIRARLRGNAQPAAAASAPSGVESDLLELGFDLQWITRAVQAVGPSLVSDVESLAAWIVAQQEGERETEEAVAAAAAEADASATSASLRGSKGRAGAAETNGQADAQADGPGLWAFGNAFAALQSAASSVSSSAAAAASSLMSSLPSGESASASAAAFAAALSGDRYKLTIAVRQDLGLSPGKIAAQVAHAALKAHKRMSERPGGNTVLAAWQGLGEAIVVLKCADLVELRAIEAAGKEAGLVTATISDAGRTEVEPGTVTVLAVGPALVSDVDAVTGKLRLL